MTWHLESASDVKAHVRTLVEQGLAEHAAAARVPTREVLPVSVVARGTNSEIVGAVLGRTVWGWLNVTELWVTESQRCKGLGRCLMNAAEAAALSRGCHGSYLDTFDFQAVPFYQKLGYSIMGKLEDFPLRHTRFFLQKSLRV